MTAPEWSAPVPIPGSTETYIEHPRGTVLRVRAGRYIAFRRDGDVWRVSGWHPTKEQAMAYVEGI